MSLDINLRPMIDVLISSDLGEKNLQLTIFDYNVCARVCKLLNQEIQPLINQEWTRIEDAVTFGKAKWLKIPGVNDVEDAPELSPEKKAKLKAILRAVCPFFNEKDKKWPHKFQNDKIKRIWQTHRVILFPKTINGKHRTKKSLGEIFHFEGENDTAYYRKMGFINDELEPAPDSYWGLMTMDIVPNTRSLRYIEKIIKVESKGYRAPMPLEAITGIMVMNIGPSKEKKGYKYYFPLTGMYGTETVTTVPPDEKDNGIGIGSASPQGLRVKISILKEINRGVAGVRLLTASEYASD